MHDLPTDDLRLYELDDQALTWLGEFLIDAMRQASDPDELDRLNALERVLWTESQLRLNYRRAQGPELSAAEAATWRQLRDDLADPR